ncbi:CBO0543 family protein [Bacillus sp. Y1]
MIVSLCLDVVGDQFGFWHYRFNVMPVLPTYFPWDVTLMPVSVMFILQIKPNLNPVIKAILFAIFSACIAEPFFHWVCSDWMEIFLFLTYTHHNIFTCKDLPRFISRNN